LREVALRDRIGRVAFLGDLEAVPKKPAVRRHRARFLLHDPDAPAEPVVTELAALLRAGISDRDQAVRRIPLIASRTVARHGVAFLHDL
jgi:hypothetical protein